MYWFFLYLYLFEQLQQWNQLAQTGSTIASSLYKSHQFYGLINSQTDFDCIWIILNNNLDNLMKVRMQKLFYQKEM